MRVLVVEDDEMIAEGGLRGLKRGDGSGGGENLAVWNEAGFLPAGCDAAGRRWLFALPGDPAVKQSAGAFSYRL